MGNHLKPNEGNYENSPQDLLNASLLFARALSNLLDEDEGIVVNVVGDVKLGDDSKQIIVFKHNEQIHISKCEHDLEEGTMVSVDSDEEFEMDLEVDPEIS